ncbi:hypothetical protein [uncultured Roseovarius sp.]|uniref:hypothetical protein n=1 Tax=uncultured Roseovarius sp. TaxID=293344 RepID=UPI0026279C4A|nr:hypothetical protein [uncultured Roseovarius sp.]
MRLRPIIPLLPFLCGIAAGCSELPPLEPGLDKAARNASYPDLVPAEQITERVPNDRINPDDQANLEKRGADLRARAARLKGGVIDTDTKSRMRAGVNP